MHFSSQSGTQSEFPGYMSQEGALVVVVLIVIALLVATVKMGVVPESNDAVKVSVAQSY